MRQALRSRVRRAAWVCGLALLPMFGGGCVTGLLLEAKRGGGEGVVEPPVSVFLTEGGELVAMARTGGAGHRHAWEIAHVENSYTAQEAQAERRFPRGSKTLRVWGGEADGEMPPRAVNTPVGFANFFRDREAVRFDAGLPLADAERRLEKEHGPGVWLDPLTDAVGTDRIHPPVQRVYGLVVDGEPRPVAVLAYPVIRLEKEPVPRVLRAAGLPFAVAADVVLLPVYAVGAVVFYVSLRRMYRNGG